MRVLLSIKPEFAEKIFAGEKHFEFRRRIFRSDDVHSAIVYSSSPVRSIIGEFEIDGLLKACPSDIWAETKATAGITREFFEAYFAGRDIAYALVIGKRRRYQTPIKPKAHNPSFVAPQSYRYVGSGEARKWLQINEPAIG